MTTLDTKALRALKQQPIERIRDAFARAHKIATGGRAHYMSIPADSERDADLILSDAIDELEALRNAAPALLDAAEERDRLRQLIPVECCNGSNPNCYGPFGCLVRAQKAQTTDKQKLVDEAEDAKAERDALKAEVERLREALTPSGATKAAYHGEFGFELLARDGEGVDYHMVPWTTIKEIMAAISKRAALRPTEGEVKP